MLGMWLFDPPDRLVARKWVSYNPFIEKYKCGNKSTSGRLIDLYWLNH